MDFPNPSKSAGSFVESIKDKLNFGSRNAEKTITRKKSTITKITRTTRISTIMANMATMNRMRSTLMAIPIPIRTPRAILIARARRALVSLDDIKSTTSAYGVMTA